MRQKFLYFVFLIVLSSMFSQAYAQTIAVQALDAISTAQPPQSISVRLLEPLELPEFSLLTGSVLKGDVIDVVSPRRLKRDATFSFKPVSYTDLNAETYNLNLNIISSYTKPLDKGKIAESAALGVGSYFVKGLSMGVAAVKGAVKNEEGNRIKSSAVSVYESSPFSYAEKGEDLDINKGDCFYLKFPNPDKVKNDDTSSDDEPKGHNYSYTIEKE